MAYKFGKQVYLYSSQYFMEDMIMESNYEECGGNYSVM
jgi:hypothetical protein